MTEAALSSIVAIVSAVRTCPGFPLHCLSDSPERLRWGVRGPLKASVLRFPDEPTQILLYCGLYHNIIDAVSVDMKLEKGRLDVQTRFCSVC